MSEGAARVAAHRLRKRFREVFREESAQTVSGPDEIDAEVRHLLTVLGE
jgi:RNA polymerase sigma-70 factor (ECF subfamily)